MRQTLALIRRLAWIGVHDVTVSQFTPYPGSDYFRELQQQGAFSADLSELGDVINFFTNKNRSYSRAFTANQMYRWMLWLYLNFYLLSFVRRPIRLFRNIRDFLLSGIENARYVRLFGEILLRRRAWKQKLHQERA